MAEAEVEEGILMSLLSLGFELEDCQRVIQHGVTDLQVAIDQLRGQWNSMEVDNSGYGTSPHVAEDDEYAKRNKLLKETYNEQLRKRRLEDSATRERVLKSFQADRMRQKDMKKSKDYNRKDTDDECTTTSVSDMKDCQEEEGHEAVGRIRVRLPDGNSLQLQLPRSTTLQEVLDAVLESVEDKSPSYTLIQPFPRKDYKDSDYLLSLEALHLFPSASLVLHIPQQIVELSDVDNVPIPCDEGNEEQEVISLEDITGCGESRLLTGNIKNEIADMEIDDVAPSGSSTSIYMRRQIDSLQMLSAKCAAQLMTVLDPKIINSMSILSSKAASQLIDVLKSWNLLSPKLMSSFIPCKLKEIHLDSYGLTTNELLEKLRYHPSVTVLSLRSCALLNDYGVSACLQRLRYIKFLNLGDCCRLTGNVLDSVVDLTQLEVLILDKLRITNENVNKFLKLQVLPNLKKLSIDYCPISTEAFLDIKDCPSLISLSFDNTQVSGLGFLQCFPNLSKLNLQNTCVTDEELENLKKVGNMKSLKLRGTNISDNGLRHLRGLHLTYINTPDRQVVGNETIAMLTGFPLQTLDLSDHIHLTDECIPSVASINTLTTLSLSNTKITDEKLVLLSALSNLEELDVSKTIVTNQITVLMKDLQLLHSINLGWTKIDDACIEDLNDCRLLSKLNLSHTNITNKGIVKLQLSQLNTLILDSTLVTWQGAEVCSRACPNLKLLRNATLKVIIAR